MLPEDKKIAHELYGEAPIVIGEVVEYRPLQVGGQAFQFDVMQRRFIYALQKYDGDIEKACNFAQRPMEWAQKFLTSRKFREFRNAHLALTRNPNELVGWWWEYGLDGAKGYRECYEASCNLCHEINKYRVSEVEATRDDAMKEHVNCKVCLQPVEAALVREEFKPSREQVQFWAEIGNRVSPKVERMLHSFSDETFVFQTGGD